MGVDLLDGATRLQASLRLRAVDPGTGGPVLATSNKLDIVDQSWGHHARVGTVWVYDVQGIIGEEPSCWRHTLSFVTDMKTAVKAGRSVY